MKDDGELHGAKNAATGASLSSLEQQVTQTARNQREVLGDSVRDDIVFPATVTAAQGSMNHATATREHPARALFDDGGFGAQSELMGPILRRKKVVSLPLGSSSGADFFRGPERTTPSPREKQLSHGSVSVGYPEIPVTSRSSSFRQRRQKQTSFMQDLLRRKQVSLDLLSPSSEDFFFAAPALNDEELTGSTKKLEPAPATMEEEEVTFEHAKAKVSDDRDDAQDESLPGEDSNEARNETGKKLFAPLRFPPRVTVAAPAGHHGGGVQQLQAPVVDEETSQAYARVSKANEAMQAELSSLQMKLVESQPMHIDLLEDLTESVKQVNDVLLQTRADIQADEQLLRQKLVPESSSTTGLSEGKQGKRKEDGDEGAADPSIIRATRKDKIKAGILFAIMVAFTVAVCTWHTHVDDTSFLYNLPVGLACVTPCVGNLITKDFFDGHSQFEPNQVIAVTMHIDPLLHDELVAHDSEHRGRFLNEGSSELLDEPIYEPSRVNGTTAAGSIDNDDSNKEVYAIVEIIGHESHQVKVIREIGPVPLTDERATFQESIVVTFDHPQEHHIISVNSSHVDVAISFTLHTRVQQPLARYSVLVAALIMLAVYGCILMEVIHRTLIAIFGSMIALLFYFIMQGGNTESIGAIMLYLEWSTLGLLFGMMLIVGELSHTGVFEWCAVRLLLRSKGSFPRLMVLLCLLTAIASAFLDNVTTMLLVAPVTIDMCNILEVDPRPYLIGEVLLSNIGGTATLIGDPPNIIIGSSYEEIGFVDFIIHILPAIFLFCVPAALLLVVWIYRYYLTSSKMRVLDSALLKRTYPIYDEPRLLISGTVAAFVILTFFLHSVHHKDTAWIALFGAFITISFTNPHDVQSALRSHVEWDTLLFFAGLFVLVEVCAAMGLLDAIGNALANVIEAQPAESQLAVAITLVIWVSAVVSAFLDNIPYTATMIPVINILAQNLPETLDLTTLAWALSFGACLGGNGTLLGASANIVTAGISTNKGFDISFLNFLYPGMLAMTLTVAICNLYMLVRYVWV